MNHAAAQPQKAAGLTRGYFICITGTILWSSTAVFIRYLMDTYHMPSFVLAFWRDAFVATSLAITFAIFSRKRLRVDRSHLKFLFLFGFILSVFNSLWTISVFLNGAAISTVLAYSSPAFTALLAWKLLGERLDGAKVLAVVLCIVGCVYVSGAYDRAVWQLNPLGIVTGLLSGVAFAVYSLMGKSASQRGIDSWTALLYTFGIAALFLLVYNMAPDWFPAGAASRNLLWLGDSVSGWVVLVILALVPTIGGYGLYTASMFYLPASVANLIATLEPSMTAAQSYVFLGERFSLPQVAGSALIIFSVVMLRISEGRRTNGQPPPGVG